ncbi:hypothetical protein BU17DRAFT_43654 [Hysterangium stoloniferum]|nr:hypothetical protein BU17DRAFT_43654 [Hysterangium stoloniferum]
MPPSRLQQRTLGLTHRIWVLVCIIIFFFLCMRLFASSDVEQRHRIFTNSNLTPKDYLNSSDMAVPFDFCPLYGPGDPLAEKYGSHALSKSKLHVGSGARVHKVIRKALAGLPVTISVLGGSVSACHGAGNEPISPICYPSLFFQWWNEVFPHPASELTNGAVRRTNSAYFSFCHSHHIPDQTDLVILEFDVEDPNQPEWLDYFELLVRSILVRPDSPAVVILGHFSPQVQISHGFAGPEFLHSVVAQYYDVPHISIKPVLYPMHLTAPETLNTYFADPVLANEGGHQLLADVLISYFQSQVCIAWASVTGTGFEVPAFPMGGSKETPTDAKGLFGGVGMRKGPNEADRGADRPLREGLANDDGFPGSDFAPFRVPPARLSARPSDLANFREVRPFCVSANDLINPLPPSLFYGSGWHAYHPSKAASETDPHYWYSTLPTSKLRIPMKMGNGDVAIYYWREDEEYDDVRSGIKCWVDDNISGARTIWNQEVGAGGAGPTLKIIDHFVDTGSHFIQCELLGEEGRGVPPFKILGIFAT